MLGKLQKPTQVYTLVGHPLYGSSG